MATTRRPPPRRHPARRRPLPLATKTPLNAEIFNKRTYDGYTAESVTFQSIPGYYTCCTLYRPLHPAAGSDAKRPAILNTHGHANPHTDGRFAEQVQHRSASVARMGAITLSVEMFAYGDSLAQLPATAHTQSTLAMPMQLWNNIRALDFLQSLPDVDASKLCVTGESGGGTQTFLLTALDSRIAINVPCVMVSSYMFGGCMCESGRPVHRDADHFCTNAEIASLCCPRPMLVISDGKDWTQHVPETEFPFLQKIYALNDVPNNVENAHFPKERHDYGPNKRLAMYKFLAQKLNLNLAATTNSRKRRTRRIPHHPRTPRHHPHLDQRPPPPTRCPPRRRRHPIPTHLPPKCGIRLRPMTPATASRAGCHGYSTTPGALPVPHVLAKLIAPPPDFPCPPLPPITFPTSISPPTFFGNTPLSETPPDTLTLGPEPVSQVQRCIVLSCLQSPSPA